MSRTRSGRKLRKSKLRLWIEANVGALAGWPSFDLFTLREIHTLNARLDALGCPYRRTASERVFRVTRVLMQVRDIRRRRYRAVIEQVMR